MTPLLFGLALVAATLALPSPASAQDGDEGFELLNFSPTAGPFGIFATERSAVLEHLTFAVRVLGDYAHEPLTTVDAGGGEVAVVEGSAVLHLTTAFGLFDIGELGLVVPFVLLNEGPGLGDEPLGDNSVGDIRIRAKARGLHPDDYAGFGLGGLLELTVPTGERSELNGAGSVTFAILAIADFTIGPVVFAANVGARFREEARARNVTRTHQFEYRGGVSWMAVEQLLEVKGEAFGSFPLGDALGDDFQSPAEWLLGVRFLTPSDIHFTLGGGSGFNEGVGAPAFRVLAGVEYAPLDPDSDRDGIPNSADDCPDVAEDADAFEDTDGCPDLDNDQDQIADLDDTCPDDAEDPDGFEDTDGCPDLDNDKDGVADTADTCPLAAEDPDGFEDDDGCPDDDNDQDGLADLDDGCPDQAEDLDGFQDQDGCPEADADSDGDGLVDAADACPQQAEDMDGFEDTDGCPDLDHDHDGVLDTVDACPTEQETINGVDDEDGCPDEGKTLVIVRDERIEILDKVFFETDKALIKPDSYALLNQVALTLRAHPELVRVRIEGHTDDVGDDEYNMKLSQERAEAVVEYLVAQGVERERLEGVGFGETQPIAEGKSKKARSTNRRVEFVITERR